jgi:hypothetical protein
LGSQESLIHPSVLNKILKVYRCSAANSSNYSKLFTSKPIIDQNIVRKIDNFGNATVVLFFLFVATQVLSLTIYGVVSFGLFLYSLFNLCYTSVKNGQNVDFHFIQERRNRLDLTKNQNHYLSCLFAIFSSDNISQETRSEWIESLWKMIEISNRLEEATNPEIKALIKTTSMVHQEVDSLRKQIEATSDETTQNIYLQGIDLLNRRIAKNERLEKYVSRTEAHLSLIELTLIESLHSIKMASTKTLTPDLVQLDSNLLRENLLTLQNNSDEVLRAIEELATN